MVVRHSAALDSAVAGGIHVRRQQLGNHLGGATNKQDDGRDL